jgi:hypothetical protein
MKQTLKETMKMLIKDWHKNDFPPIKEREKGHLSFEYFRNILAII